MILTDEMPGKDYIHSLNVRYSLARDVCMKYGRCDRINDLYPLVVITVPIIPER